MNKIFNNIICEQFYKFLYENKEYPFKPKNYRFLIIDFDHDEDQKKVLDFLEELFLDVVFLEINGDFIVFYFEELEIEIKDLFSSISDDFGINLKVFSSGKMNYEKPENFSVLYDAYKKYLDNKPYIYGNISDLIIEIIKSDMKELKKIKSVVLNKIEEDSQIEKLILAMFDNNLNVTQTANNVYMHRNTIINKLEYIKLETSLNLQNFKDANCLYWIIKTK